MKSRKQKLVRHQRHQDILNAAIKEFALHGFKGTSSQSIADRAGLSKQQLHYYIDGKEELYEKILIDIYNEWVEIFNIRDKQLTAEEVLSEYIRKKLEFSFQFPDNSKIFTSEVLRGAPVLKDMISEQSEQMKLATKTIDQWIRRGEIEPIDPMHLFFVIWGTTQYYADYDLIIKLQLDKKKFSKSDQDYIINEITSFILRGCGIKTSKDVLLKSIK